MDKSTFDSVIDFAVKKENAAESFYKDLAARPPLKQYASFFLETAAAESGHAKKLLSVQKGGKAPELPQTLINENGITDVIPMVSPGDFSSFYDVLVFCAQEEERSVKLYQDMAAKVSDSELKSLFTSLAEEEKKHKLGFEDEFNNAKGLEY
ncbi:MAG: ferritin family protein [Fibrobacterota bacterium]